jgi:hypothetical protein
MTQDDSHHVKEHYGIDTKTLADEMGEEFARECMGKEATG